MSHPLLLACVLMAAWLMVCHGLFRVTGKKGK